MKIERRSSGRLVSKRIILSEDEEKNNNFDLNHEDDTENYMNNGNRPKRKTANYGNSNSNSSFMGKTTEI